MLIKIKFSSLILMFSLSVSSMEFTSNFKTEKDVLKDKEEAFSDKAHLQVEAVSGNATPVYHDEENVATQVKTFNSKNERTYIVSEAKFAQAFISIANSCPTCGTIAQELKTLLTHYKNRMLSEKEWSQTITTAFDMVGIPAGILSQDLKLMQLILIWILDKGY